MFYVYILYSPSRDKYYTGHTGDNLEERLRKHNSDHKGFTGGSGDWQLVCRESYETKKEAYARELQIKNRKSRKYLEELVRQK